VKAPAIDLVNADLLSAHVHAEWLAAAKESLGKSIPDNLDMDAEGLPVKPVTLAAFATATTDTAAQARAVSIVASALPAEGAPQIGDPVAFVASLWAESAKEFDTAFRRWRELYRSACQDRDEAHRIGQRTGLGAQERREARARYVGADKQVELLATGVSSQSSDFYVYRYLATEGFLPGYNFPRLPLYAFVDADKSSTVLQRPRFLRSRNSGRTASFTTRARLIAATAQSCRPARATRTIHSSRAP